MRWTPEQIDQLRELRKVGRSASEIAASFGSSVTRNAIIGVWNRYCMEPAEAKVLALRPKPIPPEPHRGPRPKKVAAAQPAPAPRPPAPVVENIPNFAHPRPTILPGQRKGRLNFEKHGRNRDEDLRMAEMARAAIRAGAVQITRCPTGYAAGLTSYEFLTYR